MPLSIYNTLSRKKEEFQPIRPNSVGMYVCGPTVYGHSHIGHAKSYVTFDVLSRYLRFKGYNVTYIQNITDVGHIVGDADEGEDKVVSESRREGKSPYAIAQMYERSYWEDMDALNIIRPNVSCRATGHIIEQIELIRKLLANGHAYESNGSVYFDVTSDPEYGKLSNRRTEEMEAGARVEIREEKKHPNDFALWKRAEPAHLMQWNSPWGMGYPGWHIECSAMSMKYLGESFDIHGGGMENQFPHHECEIAQSECGTGVQPFVRYWMHHNMVTVNGKKMGKSQGNASNLKALFKTFSPLAIRFFILQGHYRSTLEFNEEAIAATQTGLEKLWNQAERLRSAVKARGGHPDSQPDLSNEDPQEFFAEEQRAFYTAMDDDLNTSVAIAAIYDIAKSAAALAENPGTNAIQLRTAENLIRAFAGDILGVLPTENDGNNRANRTGELMELIIELRKHARERKDYASSDLIRKELEKVGISLEDAKDKTSWRMNR